LPLSFPEKNPITFCLKLLKRFRLGRIAFPPKPQNPKIFFPMSEATLPRRILETLLPHLKVAAAYAQQIQSRIGARPAKDLPENFFAAALSDADLSIQTAIEVALLGTFPQVRFFGEEHEQSYNTKYFRGIGFEPGFERGVEGGFEWEGGPGEQQANASKTESEANYLVTLDPIDGTRFYLDGHSNYQIILTILTPEIYEGVIALSPAQDTYYYCLRGQGAYKGSLKDSLDTCHPLKIDQPQNTIFLGSRMGCLADALADRYNVIDVRRDYNAETQVPNVNGLLSGELTGAILAHGKLIDGSCLAFLAQEMGFILTDHQGQPLPPLHTCEHYKWPGLLIASSRQIHQDLVAVVQAATRKIL
jgi:fructose-1,6-bisphosphatase/inositol monophosphatase family enzyme